MSSNHTPALSDGILGMDGFSKSDDICCLAANSTGKFLNKGICDGSIIYINRTSSYSENNLNVFVMPDGGYLLSDKDEPDGFYFGKAIMTVNLL